MNKILLLFDVDGTLTLPRLPISKDMINVLQTLNKMENFDIGFVGGSDLSKQIEQIGNENMDLFLWKFTENGLLSYYKNIMINKMGILDYLGEENYQKLVNICLKEISETEIPKKRGQFIELRNGMINISPIGRSCTQLEREEFNELDKKYKYREKLIQNIKIELGNIADEFNFSIGGQISFDIFPKGWDKTFALQFVENKYDKIYFFGDMTHEGGNDFEIYNDNRVHGIKVNNFNETISKLNQLFFINYNVI
jgi:phosphomannomutase